MKVEKSLYWSKKINYQNMNNNYIKLYLIKKEKKNKPEARSGKRINGIKKAAFK